MKRSWAFIAALITVLIILALACVSGYVGANRLHASSSETTCIAGAGEICPPSDFLHDVDTLNGLQEKQLKLSQSPDVKALVSTIDESRGMAERLQEEVNKTIQSNPGHQWDQNKKRFVTVPIPSTPPTTPPTKTSTPKK